MKRFNGYEAHESEEIVMKNDVEAKMVNGHEETFPTLVLENCTLTNIRPKRQNVTVRKQNSKPM